MKRSEVLWLAFEKFAIFFSFVFCFTVVIVFLVLAFGAWQARDQLLSLQEGIVCDTIVGINVLLDDFESAVITRTIYISQTIPVQFAIPLEQSLTVNLTSGVPLNRPATMTLPGGGGQINGRVNLELPAGMRLPIHMALVVPVNQQLPVQMEVPVAIPLNETDLGAVIQQLRDLLAPLQLAKLEQTLKCQP